MKIEAKSGEVLQLIAADSRADGADARQAYYDEVLPPAAALGFRRLGQLNVSKKIVSDYDPGAFIFFSWPDQRSEETFRMAPDYPAIVAARPAGWDELKIFSAVLQEDLSLTFHTAKAYTVVVAYFDETNPGDYERYLSGIEPAVERAGGRFIYKMRSPTLEAHASDRKAPGQITFVEWEDESGFDRVQKSPEYLEHREFFGSGTTGFEFYWLKPSVRR